MVRLAAAVLLTTLLLLAGCTSIERTTDSQEPAPGAQPSSRLTTMPALIGTTLEEASVVFGDTDFEPTVTFPGYEAQWSEEATYIAGTQVPAHDETVSVGARSIPLRELYNGTHVITKQQPAAGAALSTSTAIDLEAGPHPNDSGWPWLTSGHKFSIRESGTMSCFECHDAPQCSRCHAQLD